MKFYLNLSLFCAFVLAMTIQLKLNDRSRPVIKVPFFLQSYQQSIKAQFKKPENANLLFSFLFGARQGISPHTLKAFKKNNLTFLLSPSGVHLSALFVLIGFALKKIPSLKLRKSIKIALLTSSFFLPHYDSIKRLALLRLAFHFKMLAKFKASSETILLIVFFIAFLTGHFFSSPIGFVLSLLYIGTFFSLGDRPKYILLLALFSNQILISLFLGMKTSFLSVISGTMGVFLFSLLYPVLLIFFLSFWLISINWIEPFLQCYVTLLKLSAVQINGSFTSASIFLLFSIWSLLFIKKKSLMKICFAIFLLLHTNTAMTPSFFSS